MPESRVEVVETSWTPGLPATASRRLLALLFDPPARERDAAESGEADRGEESA
jgi:hypothetical protein